MDFHKVFFVATANDIEALPPEMIRKGRLDEIFFVDLPDSKTREIIFRIHLGKRKLNPDDFNVELLADEESWIFPALKLNRLAFSRFILH